jgi:hypothetical protein
VEADVSGERRVGAFGRLPAQFPGELRDLTWYVAGKLPKAPATQSNPTPLNVPDDGTVWGMLGNDQYGDCGVAGLEHGFMSAAAFTGNTTETNPSDQDAVDYYLDYTDGQDDGVVLSDYLGYVKKNGYYGKQVLAYAPVSISDIATLHFATWAYNFTYTGITVTEQMQEDFQDGKPWTLESMDSPVAGGHCVPLVGYDSQYLYCVTWGAIQAIAYSAWSYMASEAWAIITGEISAHGADGHGVNLAALQADLKKLKK